MPPAYTITYSLIHCIGFLGYICGLLTGGGIGYVIGKFVSKKGSKRAQAGKMVRTRKGADRPGSASRQVRVPTVPKDAI